MGFLGSFGALRKGLAEAEVEGEGDFYCEGDHPLPFTYITYDEILQEVWIPGRYICSY